MITERIFSADVGDESTLTAGPDAIEKDLDNLFANDAELIPKTDIVNDLLTGGEDKVLSAEQGKTLDNKIDAILLTNNNISSYLSFCANANTDSLDSAFGKNNESYILKVGLQLAMYVWFKGDSKTTYPFTKLIACSSFQDCLDNALDEIMQNKNILELIYTSPYARELCATKIITAENLKTICMSPTLSIAMEDYLQNYRDKIITVLDADTTYFSKTNDAIQALGLTSNTLYSYGLGQDTIWIPTNISKLKSSGTTEVQRNLYYGADSTKTIWYKKDDLELATTVDSGVSLRGIYYQYDWISDVDLGTLTYDLYTVI